MKPIDFIATARRLAEQTGRGRPLETDLRRATSTAYYALFHCLAQSCADLLVGGPGSARDLAAWTQTYRALQHRTASQRCSNLAQMRGFPVQIRDFGKVFVRMQIKRHDADYNPGAEFTKNAVIQNINESENAITGFGRAPIKDRRAFAVYVLLDNRRS